MRKDAETNREQLIRAGGSLMRNEGGNVPVERICAVAGVTRGTFYRHFTDRAMLYGAVLEHELEAMAHRLAQAEEDPLAFIRLFGEMMMVYDKFLAVLPEMDDYPAHGSHEAKIVAVLAPSLRKAQQAGLIAAHVTGPDILLGCRMIAANWRHDRQPTREAAMERRLALLMTGLRPAG